MILEDHERELDMYLRFQRSAFATAALLLCALGSLLAHRADAEIRRNPTGVNVNSQAATTVFITFAGLDDQVPVEATWCGELIPATPDIGLKCDPATVFGRLPIRFDQSRISADGSVFTDIMSIPPSVARRAYQAAARGEVSSFFYVRRFASRSGGPDEYVTVTCRLTGGGARTPLALLDVRLLFGEDQEVLSIARDATPPPVTAEIKYNGSGRLVGRWEVVLPGQEPPSDQDLLTEATLPPDQRPLQRRYTQLERFNVYLPPTGRVVLQGPDPSRIPTGTDGLYRLLLRIEASNDKEADSSLAAVGAGNGVIHAGAVAGFPMPVLRYTVGSESEAVGPSRGLVLLTPTSGARVPADRPLDLRWTIAADALTYELQLAEEGGDVFHRAVVLQGIGTYRLPAWLLTGEHAATPWRWRVLALGEGGKPLGATEWRSLRVASAGGG
jgi:hypothetical protein